MLLQVWVEVKNALGSERSEELKTDASYFGMISACELGKHAFYTLYECITSTGFFCVCLFCSKTKFATECSSPHGS